jgi:uncharacterized protein YjbI with pentapeptide repeats
LQGAKLQGAYLRDADLWCADLRGADLQGAKLSGADLSGSIGLLDASKWLKDHFVYDDGYIVYRAQCGQYAKPEQWEFEPNAILTETANPARGTLCGCGVHFATLEWVKSHHKGETIWKCRIEPQDLPGIVVPFGTDGKARCERLVLIEIVED